MKLKDTKTTEFEQALYDSLEQMKEEFKVLADTTKIMKAAIAASNIIIEKQKKSIAELQKDVCLERPRYGGTPTRQIAIDAFNQSTAVANWASLEEHPVIKNLYESLKDSRKDLGRSIKTNAIRIDHAQPANEVFKELEGTYIIKEITQRLDDFDGNLQCLDDTMSIDRKNANKQDHRLIDRIADIQTAQDALEFIQSETILMQDLANMFTIGAFAAMKYEPVAEGLREILKKPKGEKKENGKTQG